MTFLTLLFLFQRNKIAPQPVLHSGGGSYPNTSISYMMMPPVAAQRAYTSPATAHMALGYPPPAYNPHAHAQAQAQYEPPTPTQSLYLPLVY
jgi:hypothetical protein